MLFSSYAKHVLCSSFICSIIKNLKFCKEHFFSFFSLLPIPMAISPSVSVSLSLPPLMCFLCEWKTERSYASAAHQTFTSCGALECKREKDRQEKKGRRAPIKETKAGIKRQKMKTQEKQTSSEGKNEADRMGQI